MANNGNNPITDSESADSKLVSFADAARSLGLDLFTFHSIVQREEIPTSFTAWGEFAVSQETLNKLATAKESPC